MNRFSALLCTVVSAALAVAAALGPLGWKVVRFHLGHDAIVQYQGGEVVMLVVAAALLLAAWMWWQQHAAAPAISLGASLFVVYTMLTVVLPQEYEQFPQGNLERWILLYAGICALASMLALLSIDRLLGTPIALPTRADRATTIFLAVQAGLFLLLWVGQILAVQRSGLTADAAQSRLLFWMIKFLDLGIVIPVSVATILLLRARRPLAAAAAIAVTGFTMWMMLAIAAMAIAQWLAAVPDSNLVLPAPMIALAGWAGAIWWRWTRRAGQQFPQPRPSGAARVG